VNRNKRDHGAQWGETCQSAGREYGNWRTSKNYRLGAANGGGVKRVARPSCHHQGCGLCMYEGVGELSISGSIMGKFEQLGNKKRNDPNIIIIHNIESKSTCSSVPRWKLGGGGGYNRGLLFPSKGGKRY
jgi:hypothetical protein